jgi:DNA-binding MarR family transcriptional regulator
MKQLAGEWHCDASYVTSLVDGLEERGIVERRAHPTDRRAKVIVLTEEGARIRADLLDRMHEPPEWFGALSDPEVELLRDLLARLVEASTQTQPGNQD